VKAFRTCCVLPGEAHQRCAESNPRGRAGCPGQCLTAALHTCDRQRAACCGRGVDVREEAPEDHPGGRRVLPPLSCCRRLQHRAAPVPRGGALLSIGALWLSRTSRAARACTARTSESCGNRFRQTSGMTCSQRSGTATTSWTSSILTLMPDWRHWSWRRQSSPLKRKWYVHALAVDGAAECQSWRGV
jgi:hypothetical protein